MQRFNGRNGKKNRVRWGEMLFFLEELTIPMMFQSLLMSDFCILQIFVAFSVDVLKINDGYFLSLRKRTRTWLPVFLKFTLKGFLHLGFSKHVNVIFHRNRAVTLLGQPRLLSPISLLRSEARWCVWRGHGELRANFP